MKLFRVSNAFIFVAVVIVALNACAGAGPSSQAEEIYVEAPQGITLSGNYLAGRFAQRQQDWKAAQQYMNAATGFDSDNNILEQRAFLLSLGAGNYTRAQALAEKIAPLGSNSELAQLYLACDALKRDDFAEALAALDELPEDGFGRYTKPLLTAWTLAGQGKTEEALKILQENADAEDPTYNIHAGLIEEMSGDTQSAAAHYKSAVENGLTLHSAVMAADFFQREGHPEVAKTIYEKLGKLYPLSPFSAPAAARAERLKPNVTRAADGAGLVLFDLASLLYERRAYDSARIYGSLVQMLTPDSPFAMLMMGDLYALHDQYAEAVKSYDGVPKTSPVYWLSRMRVAEVFEAQNQTEKSIALLNNLSETKQTKVQALVALGDLHRRHEKFDLALDAYDKALAAIGAPTEEHWSIVYARGMSLERLNKWALAEKDLMAALAFQPDNPMILNYIGYSWAEKGVNLEKAIDFTRRAAEMRPDDGYILDSYGWALYQSGRTADAIEWLERAVSFVPDDSTVLSHLGDAYWQAGRRNEARFKWRRAQEVSKDAATKTALQNKIRYGLETQPAQVAHNKDTQL